MTTHLRVLSVVIAAGALPAAAFAQQPAQSKSPVAPQTEQRDPTACSKQHTTVGQAGDLKMQEQPGSLSDHLASTDGVICPPARIDPDIKAQTPEGGAITVIKPQDDPNVRPK